MAAGGSGSQMVYTIIFRINQTFPIVCVHYLLSLRCEYLTMSDDSEQQIGPVFLYMAQETLGD